MFAIDSSKSRTLVEKAMSAREIRQNLISSNIANIDTPFYKSRDINFEDALIKQSKEIYNKKDKELELAKTSPDHFNAVKFPNNNIAKVFLRDGHLSRNDANTVDLDVESTELSKNAIMLSALDNAYKKDSSIFKSVIDASSKV